ncbi:AMP-binding protein [Wenyingzhuangia sp. 2_MG-2023]|uniref:AMP-binding protein n=1 Tax=Wenyingzhuangia sp. 2_MG-2023 TaxID=3062639 RepID=UPI0026E3B790|nr:AMP-binding protein [Wenyingzhuangia sp. 2_MG-2023]MDO6738041.1 AMP-binding protein [Wenyingzhuangia sp. 2_MG-2023]
MSNFSIHSSFLLNGEAFETPLELISYSEGISDDLYWFLQEWFSDSETLIVQTSGSTGTPKLVAIKKEFMENSAKATSSFLKLGAETKALCCLSTQYIAGKMMVIRALTLGWELDVMEPNGNPLEDIFESYDFCAMVPMQVKASLWDLHLVKKLLIGGGVVSEGLQEALQNVSTQCFASYGMTETVSHIAVKKLNCFAESTLSSSEQHISTSLDDQEVEKIQLEVFERSREAGLTNSNENNNIFTPLDDQRINKAQIKVFERSREADPKKESTFRREGLNSHYVLLPNITISQDNRDCLIINAPLLSEEEVVTNDIVKIHSETEFEWLGRFDNVINSGGVKLHPEQIEKELSKVIGQRFFVAGIKDETLGEKLILIVEGENTDLNFTQLNLSKYELPKEIYFLPQFIETKTNKIQRQQTLALLN